METHTGHVFVENPSANATNNLGLRIGQSFSTSSRRKNKNTPSKNAIRNEVIN